MACGIVWFWHPRIGYMLVIKLMKLSISVDYRSRDKDLFLIIIILFWKYMWFDMLPIDVLTL